MPSHCSVSGFAANTHPHAEHAKLDNADWMAQALAVVGDSPPPASRAPHCPVGFFTESSQRLEQPQGHLAARGDDYCSGVKSPPALASDAYRITIMADWQTLLVVALAGMVGLFGYWWGRQSGWDAAMRRGRK